MNEAMHRQAKEVAVGLLAETCGKHRLAADEVLGRMKPPGEYDFASMLGLLRFAMDAGAACQVVLEDSASPVPGA